MSTVCSCVNMCTQCVHILASRGLLDRLGGCLLVVQGSMPWCPKIVILTYWTKSILKTLLFLYTTVYIYLDLFPILYLVKRRPCDTTTAMIDWLSYINELYTVRCNNVSYKRIYIYIRKFEARYILRKLFCDGYIYIYKTFSINLY